MGPSEVIRNGTPSPNEFANYSDTTPMVVVLSSRPRHCRLLALITRKQFGDFRLQTGDKVRTLEPTHVVLSLFSGLGDKRTESGAEDRICTLANILFSIQQRNAK